MNPTDEAKVEDSMEDWGNDPESGAVVGQAPAAYPEFPANPHNHRFTVSIDGRGPMLVLRANTGAELQAAAEELEDPSAGAAIGRAWAAFKAGAALGNGLGAAPMAPGAPAPVQAVQPVPLPQSPQAQYPVGPPPLPQGPAPAQWQNAGAPAPQQGGGRAQPKQRPMDWPQVYKISIARGDTSFKQFREQNQQYFKGKVQWAGGGDYWIHGEVAQAVAQWNPVPA